MIGVPPVDADQRVRVAVVLPTEALTIAGALGVVIGVADTTLDAAPGPTAFTRRIATWYVVPFVNPLIVMSGPSFNTGVQSVHVEPPSSEY